MNAETASEHELLAAAASGNQDAYGDLVRKYLRDVYRFAWAMSGDEHARRVTENAFVTAWHQMPYFERINMEFRNHLLQLVCIDAKDVSSHRGRALLLMALLDNGSRLNPSVPPLRYEPHSSMEHLALQADIEEAVHNLPFRFRRLLLFHELSGLSPAEISDITGADTDAIYNDLRSAYAMLRKQMISGGGFFRPFGNQEESPRRYKACKEWIPTLTAAARGLCTGAEQQLLQEHIDQCPGCHGYYDALCVIRHGISIMKRDPPAELTYDIMERIGKETSASGEREPRRRRFRPAFGRFTIIGLCIALVLLAYSGFLPKQEKQETPPPPPNGTLIPGTVTSTTLIPEGERYAAVYMAREDAESHLSQYCDFSFRATLTNGQEVLYFVVPLDHQDTLTALLTEESLSLYNAEDAIDTKVRQVLYIVPLSR